MKNEVDNGKGGIALEAGVVLKMQGICMTFPGVKALEGVDLTLKKGEIRALMGENGAGKSTLIKCLTGVNKFEAGEIYLEGFDHPIVNFLLLPCLLPLILYNTYPKPSIVNCLSLSSSAISILTT